MLSCRIKGSNLKEVVDALSIFLDSVRIHITNSGLSVKAVDQANVAMVALSLSEKAFEHFNASNGEIAVDLVKFASILELMDKEGTAEIVIDEKEHKLRVEFNGLAYTLSLLDPTSMKQEPKIPKIDLPVEFTVPGTELKYGMKAAEKIATYVFLSMKNTVFSITASGDTDDMVYPIAADKITIKKSADVSSMFAIDYLNQIVKVAEKSDEVTVLLGKDYPLRLKFSIAEKNGNLEYMIAPRVESG
jgi:proliferating cell nuclear antigen